ncbi:hypothetical protein QO016_004770 [Methylobacterium persicinum]|uniref:Uncharacterized protein n=1 Tax=Methylobacterium persicinum TaxID=374426 RepID=A0ABU0HTS1_9HYPH|nr:hypothetical protein [Methylobacterium persicinum]GJE37867.1 hypothetical protein KHHGKMAE_1929 [Methylobacterium persicinum]
MWTAFRLMPALGFASSGLLLVSNYSDGKPPDLIALIAAVMACMAVAVRLWRHPM